MKAQTETCKFSYTIPLPSTLDVENDQCHSTAALIPRNKTVTVLQEAGWSPGPVSTVVENLAPAPGFDPRTIHHVAQSLNRLSYPAHKKLYVSSYCNSSLSLSVIPSLGMESRAQFCKSS